MTVGVIRRSVMVGVGVAVGAFIGAFFVADSASAATPPVGSFPVWAQTSSSTFSGRFSTAAGGGTVAVTTTGLNARVAESGTASFLGASTGFGQHFGSSRYQSYLTIGLATSPGPSQPGANSVTTVTLPTLPVGWGFAVGDIDADMVSIDASGTSGPLTAAELGPQDTSGTPLLNYCNNASPKPSSCGPGTSFPDHPWWCPTGFQPAPSPCASATMPRTVVGNGVDTQGAYDWFIPTASVTTLTLTYQWLLGTPSFQLWIVAPAPAAVVSGTILDATGAAAPAGTTLTLEDNGGTPVPDIQNQPTTVPVAVDGSFSLTTEFGSYQLAVDPPPGFATPAPFAFTAAGDTVSLPVFALAAAAAPIDPAVTAVPTLPSTGTDITPLVIASVVLVILGVVLSAVAMLRRRRRNRT
jgi:hypothetical protein